MMGDTRTPRTGWDALTSQRGVRLRHLRRIVREQRESLARLHDSLSADERELERLDESGQAREKGT